MAAAVCYYYLLADDVMTSHPIQTLLSGRWRVASGAMACFHGSMACFQCTESFVPWFLVFVMLCYILPIVQLTLGSFCCEQRTNYWMQLNETKI